MNIKNQELSKVMRLYRKMYDHNLRGHKKIARMYQHIIRLLYSADIPYTVKLGKNADLMHGGLGTVIHENAVVGDNCKIYQHVTLAGNDNGAPIIGNNVLIGTGAFLLGPIKVGDNAKIGANAVVLTDVPANATAVGVPAKIIERVEGNVDE